MIESKIELECKCPNCKKIIQQIIIKRPYLRHYNRKKKGIRIAWFKAIKGIYKWRVKPNTRKEK